jgi:hypothetical protein
MPVENRRFVMSTFMAALTYVPRLPLASGAQQPPSSLQMSACPKNEIGCNEARHFDARAPRILQKGVAAENSTARFRVRFQTGADTFNH